MQSEELLEKYAALKAESCVNDAENSTSHEEEYASLARKLAVNWSDDTLKAEIANLESNGDDEGE